MPDRPRACDAATAAAPSRYCPVIGKPVLFQRTCADVVQDQRPRAIGAARVRNDPDMRQLARQHPRHHIADKVIALYLCPTRANNVCRFGTRRWAMLRSLRFNPHSLG